MYHATLRSPSRAQSPPQNATILACVWPANLSRHLQHATPKRINSWSGAFRFYRCLKWCCAGLSVRSPHKWHCIYHTGRHAHHQSHILDTFQPIDGRPRTYCHQLKKAELFRVLRLGPIGPNVKIIRGLIFLAFLCGCDRTGQMTN